MVSPSAAPAPVAVPEAHVPLGIRIHNPLNVRLTKQVWHGQAPDQSAGKGFVVYLDEIAGLRAGAIVLINYQRHDRCETPEQFIARFAPPVENDTAGYIDFMCNAKTGLGLGPKQQIVMRAPGFLCRWIPRQILREQGVMPYSSVTIATAVDQAIAATGA